MKKLGLFVFIGLVCLGLVIGCRAVRPVSLSSVDSVRTDTFTRVDSIYISDPTAWNMLYECDSLGNIVTRNSAFWMAKFDSLSKVSPIVRTVVKTKYHSFYVAKKEYLPGVVQEKVVYKIHPITYVAFGFGILCMIFAIYMKRNGTRLRTRERV